MTAGSSGCVHTSHGLRYSHSLNHGLNAGDGFGADVICAWH